MTRGKVNNQHRVKLLLDIDSIQRLRNRVPHSENILIIQTDQYLDKMLTVLSAIVHSISDWVMDQTGTIYWTLAKLKYHPVLLQAEQKYDPLSSDQEIVALS